MTLRQLLRIKDIANMAEVKESRVRYWIRTGKLPAYKLGVKIIRIKTEDWERLQAELRN